MNATSGPTSSTQFAVYDHDSHSWKMWPAIGLWGSIEYSETVPKTGYMSGGRLYELPTSEPAIDENDSSSSSLLPTPTATQYGSNQSPSPGVPVRPSLDGLVRMLPTPRAADGQASMTAPAARAHTQQGMGSLAEVLGATLHP